MYHAGRSHPINGRRRNLRNSTDLQKAAQLSRMSKGAWVRNTLKEALERSGQFARNDSVARLAALDAPTADIDRMLEEIEAARV